jgi:hypothetical protein
LKFLPFGSLGLRGRKRTTTFKFGRILII